MISTSYKLMHNNSHLYFLVEDTVRPFETACSVGEYNSEEFAKICRYFFGEL